MTTDEVERLLGPPDEQRESGSWTQWTYEKALNPGWVEVYFNDGRFDRYNDEKVYP